MTTTTSRHPRTFVSSDGTEIGVFSSGEGPPLLLVHGSLGDHTRWDALRPHLEPHWRVHAMDRRGRGASGDASEYAIAREAEDVVAVVEGLAAEAGTDVDVYCSSYGGLCAFTAPAHTARIRQLALYEAWPAPDPAAFATPDDVLRQIETLLAAGDREGMLTLAYRAFAGVDEDELERIRAQPSWPNRVAAAHTVPREVRAFEAYAFDPEEAARVRVPTLLLVGSESDVWRRDVDTIASALPDARVVEMPGQGHAADLLAPGVVAANLIEHLLRER